MFGKLIFVSIVPVFANYLRNYRKCSWYDFWLSLLFNSFGFTILIKTVVLKEFAQLPSLIIIVRLQINTFLGHHIF